MTTNLELLADLARIHDALTDVRKRNFCAGPSDDPTSAPYPFPETAFEIYCRQFATKHDISVEYAKTFVRAMITTTTKKKEKAP